MSRKKNVDVDALWESVFSIISSEGRLSHFYKLPRYEMKAIMLAHNTQSFEDLAYLFALIHQGKNIEAMDYFQSKGLFCNVASLMHLVRSLLLWKNLENSDGALVAHA